MILQPLQPLQTLPKAVITKTGLGSKRGLRQKKPLLTLKTTLKPKTTKKPTILANLLKTKPLQWVITWRQVPFSVI
jgi:hypothetical protein